MESRQKGIKYKELLSLHRPDKVAIIKSLLSGNNISFRVEGEHFTSIYPLGHPCKIMVDEKELDKAKQLLKDFE